MASAAAFALDGDVVFSAGIDLDDEIGSGVTQVRIPTGRVAGVFNPSFALVSAGPGRLELEVPVMWSGGAEVFISGDEYAGADSTWSVIPGVRYRFAPERRLSPFAGFGVGIASATSFGVARFGIVRIEEGTRHLALGYGGGLDLRVIGPLKLRGELRTVALRNTLGGESRWEHRPLFMGGIGFNF
jgi:hypothetical protein